MKLQTKSLKKLLATVATAITIQSIGIVTVPSASYASTIQIAKCPASGSISEDTFKATIDGSSEAVAGCYTPAASYEINIYEVGICTQSPISNGAFSRSTCATIFLNQSGTGYINIANSSVDLSNGYLPSNDSTSRSYAYVIINPTIKTSGSYSTTTRTYYSGDTNYLGFSSGAAGVESKLVGPASTFSFTAGVGYDIDPGIILQCYGGASLASYNVSYALLNAADSVPAVAGGICNGATKIVISMNTSTPVTAASILNLRFNVSEYALIVQSHDIDFPNKAVPAFTLGIPLIDIISQ